MLPRAQGFMGKQEIKELWNQLPLGFVLDVRCLETYSRFQIRMEGSTGGWQEQRWEHKMSLFELLLLPLFCLLFVLADFEQKERPHETRQ